MLGAMGQDNETESATDIDAPRALTAPHARIERHPAGTFELIGRPLSAAISIGEKSVALSVDNRSGQGDICVVSHGLETPLTSSGPAVVIQIDPSAWTEATGAAPPPLSADAPYFGAASSALRSASRLLADLVLVDRTWQPIHDGLLAVIFSEINRSFWDADHLTPPCSSQVARAIKLIDTRMHAHLSLDDLAAAAGWSPYHFARRFKSETGESPSRYLRLRRIERAQRMIRETDESLCDIALACGFTSQSQMTTAFTGILGMSPARFRRAGVNRKLLVRRGRQDDEDCTVSD